MSCDSPQLSPEARVECVYRGTVLPKVSELLQTYGVDSNQILEIQLADFDSISSPDELKCCFHYGIVVVGSPEECNGASCPEMPPEQKQQFCKEIASILGSEFGNLKEMMEKPDVSKIIFFVTQDVEVQSDDEFKACCIIPAGFCCAPNRQLLRQRCGC